MKRLFILSLDGVPYTLLKSLAEKGVMPFFSGLLNEKESFRRYNSVIPTISSVAWACFMTGKNPGSHGIFGFIERQPNPFRLYIPTGKHLRAKTIFEILSDAGKRVISFNVPMTTPPRKVNGVMVSGFLSTKLHSAVHPPEVAQKLEYLGYIIDVDASLAVKDEKRFMEEIERALQGRMNAIKSFISQDWDLFMMHVMETDRVNHFFINREDTLVPFYRRIDEFVKEVAELLPEHTELLLLSDHGFCPIEKEFYLNRFLEEKGLLKFRKNPPESLKDMAPSTIAYSLIPGRVYINLKGREEMGSVNPHNYEKVRDEVVSVLKELVEKGIVKKIYIREELYSGPFMDEAGDIILEPVDGIDIKGNINKKELFGISSVKGMHTFDDAFILWKGKTLKENNSFSIVDIAHSVFEVLDVETPDDLEGKGCLA